MLSVTSGMFHGYPRRLLLTDFGPCSVRPYLANHIWRITDLRAKVRIAPARDTNRRGGSDADPCHIRCDWAYDGFFEDEQRSTSRS